MLCRVHAVARPTSHTRTFYHSEGGLLGSPVGLPLFADLRTGEIDGGQSPLDSSQMVMKTYRPIPYGPVYGERIQVDQEWIWIRPHGVPSQDDFLGVSWTGEISIPPSGGEYLLRCSSDKPWVVIPRDKLLR